MTAEINRLPKQYRPLISAPPLSDFINESVSLHRYVTCLAHTAPALLQALASATLELTIGRSRRACILDLSPIRGDRVIALRRQVRAIETGRPDTALGQMVSGFGCQVTRPFATASPASSTPAAVISSSRTAH